MRRVEPERVARRIVGLARRPRRAVRVGSLNLLSLPYALIPETTARISARLGRRYLLRSGPPAPPTPGALFGPMPGPAEARGDWGDKERRRARQAVAGLAVAAAGVAVARAGQERTDDA